VPSPQAQQQVSTHQPPRQAPARPFPPPHILPHTSNANHCPHAKVTERLPTPRGARTHTTGGLLFVLVPEASNQYSAVIRHAFRLLENMVHARIAPGGRRSSESGQSSEPQWVHVLAVHLVRLPGVIDLPALLAASSLFSCCSYDDFTRRWSGKLVVARRAG
jgi:hypothetical protein